MRATFPFLASSAVAALLLSGCATAANPRLSSDERSTSPAPSASSTPAAQLIGAITFGPRAIVLDDADGVAVATLGFDDDPQKVVAALTAAIAAAPSVTSHPGGTANDADVPRTEYDWSGLILSVPDGGVPGDGASDYTISATQPSVNERAVQTSSGVFPGMSAADARSVADRVAIPSGPSTADRYLLESWTRPSSSGETWTDWVAADVAGGTVTRIVATLHGYGA